MLWPFQLILQMVIGWEFICSRDHVLSGPRDLAGVLSISDSYVQATYEEQGEPCYAIESHVSHDLIITTSYSGMGSVEAAVSGLAIAACDGERVDRVGLAVRACGVA